MKRINKLFLTALLVSLTSCTINNHEVDGDVDLVYSDTIEIRASDFVHEDEFVSVAEYGWDNLDENMVDNGLVLGYIRFEGTTAWQALPYSIPYQDDLVNLRYLFDINNFSLIIEGENAGNNEDNVAHFHGDVLRIVAIPPSEVVKAKGIDYRNYEQVSELYNLDD